MSSSTYSFISTGIIVVGDTLLQSQLNYQHILSLVNTLGRLYYLWLEEYKKRIMMKIYLLSNDDIFTSCDDKREFENTSHLKTV